MRAFASRRAMVALTIAAAGCAPTPPMAVPPSSLRASAASTSVRASTDDAAPDPSAPIPSTPSEPTAPAPGQADTPALPRADVHGDPLPIGAMARIGTMRQRAHGDVARLFLDNDGPLIAWVRPGYDKLAEVDVASGRKLRDLTFGKLRRAQPSRARDFVLAEVGGAVQLHDAAGKLLRSFAFPAAKKTAGKKRVPRMFGRGPSVLLSEDDRAVALSRERSVIVYDVRTGATRGRLTLPPTKPKHPPPTGHKEEPRPIRVSALAGDRVLVGDADYGFGLSTPKRQLWDVRARRKLADIEGAAALSADGQHLVVAHKGKLRWSKADGTVVREADLPSGKPGPFSMGTSANGFVISRDATHVAFNDDGDAYVYATRDLRERGVVVDARVRALSPDGKRLAVGRDGHLYLRSSNNPADLPDDPPSHGGGIDRVTFGPHGRVISTVGREGDWRLWDAATGAPLVRVSSGHGFPDGYRQVAISKTDVLALTSEELLRGTWGSDQAAKLVAKDRAAVALGSRGFASLSEMGWNDQGGRKPTTLSWHDMDGAVAWSHEVATTEDLDADDRHVVAVEPGKLVVFETATGTEVQRIGDKAMWLSGGVHLRPDRVFVGDHGLVAFERRADGTLVPLRRIPARHARATAVSADGRKIAYASRNGIDVLTELGEPLGRFPQAHGDDLTALAFSPDGQRLASASRDGTALVWDLRHLPAWPADDVEAAWHAMGGGLRRALTRSCTIADTGTVDCRLVLGDHRPPADVFELHGYRSYACVVAMSQRAVSCWKRPRYGKPAQAVAIGGSIVAARSLAVHPNGGCAVDGSDRARCWGKVVGDRDSSDAFRTLASGVRELGLGDAHGCLAKKDGSVWCWGTGLAAGARLPEHKVTLHRINGLRDVVDLSVASNYSCAVRSDGTAACWGLGQEWQLGDGRGLSSAKPVPVSGVSDARAIAAARNTACVLGKGGTLSCWGYRGLRSQRGAVTVATKVDDGVDEIADHDDLCKRSGTTWSCL
jgi:WD40 repeat protein